MKKTLYIAIFSLILVPGLSFASIDTNLGFGSQGQPVVDLQQFLISKGFLSGETTGNFLSLTKKAVADYQQSVHLPSTGFVGPLTRAEINKEIDSTTTVSTNDNPVSDSETSSPIVLASNTATSTKIGQSLIAAALDAIKSVEADPSDISINLGTQTCGSSTLASLPVVTTGNFKSGIMSLQGTNSNGGTPIDIEINFDGTAKSLAFTNLEPGLYGYSLTVYNYSGDVGDYKIGNVTISACK